VSEPMQVWVEVWPVAADDAGIWLVSGLDAWRPSLPVMADEEPHADVELVLHENSAADDAVLLHSTSWRVDGPGVVLTYVAVLRKPGYVRANWPGAEPISPRLPRAVGRPLAHGAAEPPLPRHVDVLMHAVRHLRFLLDTDDTAAASLDAHWRRHLAEMTSALAGMYRTQ
jgi:hypothetical protein